MDRVVIVGITRKRCLLIGTNRVMQHHPGGVCAFRRVGVGARSEFQRRLHVAFVVAGFGIRSA